MLTVTILIVMGFWEVKIKSQPLSDAARPNTWESTMPSSQGASTEQVFLEDTTPRPLNNSNATNR